MTEQRDVQRDPSGWARLMNVYETHSQQIVAVCLRHGYFVDDQGWTFLEQRDRHPDWPCYFRNNPSFWHKIRATGQSYSSRGLTTALQIEEATTLDGYRAIVRRAYGNLRGVEFGIEKPTC